VRASVRRHNGDRVIAKEKSPEDFLPGLLLSTACAA
jgi:hypothetical protein